MTGAAQTRAAVVGGGTMGAGIAHALARSGHDVVIYERDAGLAAGAERAVLTSMARELAKAPNNPAAVSGAVAGRVWGSDGLAGFGVVIEAVPEQFVLKADVLRACCATLSESALLASNTSALSIDRLAEALPHPEQFVGMHFFNPVPRSQLVEVVRGVATSPATLATAHALADRLGLTSIEVRDSPGFATSRLGLALGLEAIRMVEDAVASVAAIDQAMMLGYKHPIGPLRLTDLIGLDVRLDIARHLAGELGPRFEPPQLLADMVAEGRLGKKTGHGFYDWD